MRKWKKYVAVCLVLALSGNVPAARVLGDVTDESTTPGDDDPGKPADNSSEKPNTGSTEPDTSSETPTDTSSEQPGTTTETPTDTSTDTPTDKPTENPGTENPTTQPSTEKTTEGNTSVPEVGPWPDFNPVDADDPAKADNKEDKAGAEGPVIIQTVVTQSGNEVYTAQAIAALQQQAVKIKEQKVTLQKELNGYLTAQNDYITKLKLLDDKILELQDQLDAMDEQKKICENTVTELQSQLESAQEKENEQYEALKLHIQNEYENGNTSIYDVIFQAAEFSELINRVEYISEFNSFEEGKLNELSDTRRSIADQKLMMETMIEGIGVVEESYQDQQEILQMYSDAKTKQIESYQADIDNAKASIATLEQLEQQQSATIAQLEASYRTTTTYVQYTYSGDKMLWPMPSSGEISSYFGYRDRPNAAGATSDHRGIDIPCDEGSPCIAAASGVVMYTGYMGTGGNAVLIDCGSGITIIYYHLSGFNVTVGQKVNAGDVVAFSGNTGASTGPHLHFGVRINGEYQDPLDFLF